MKRDLNKKRHLKTFLYVLLIFLSGIFIGNIITEQVSKSFSNNHQEMTNYILSLDLQMKLAEENICDIGIFELTDEKVRLGRELTLLEKEMGEDDPELIMMKHQYTLLSIRQWMFVEKVKEDCGEDITTILFFYSNEENASMSEDQGYVLDYLYDKYPNLVANYAFDYDIDTPALNTVKMIYGVDSVPTLVVNGETLEGFQSTYTLEKLIFTT